MIFEDFSIRKLRASLPPGWIFEIAEMKDWSYIPRLAKDEKDCLKILPAHHDVVGAPCLTPPMWSMPPSLGPFS
jgi:hypothetical protein